MQAKQNICQLAGKLISAKYPIIGLTNNTYTDSSILERMCELSWISPWREEPG